MVIGNIESLAYTVFRGVMFYIARCPSYWLMMATFFPRALVWLAIESYGVGISTIFFEW